MIDVDLYLSLDTLHSLVSPFKCAEDFQEGMEVSDFKVLEDIMTKSFNRDWEETN